MFFIRARLSRFKSLEFEIKVVNVILGGSFEIQSLAIFYFKNNLIDFETDNFSLLVKVFRNY